jgi:diamine N-acetyltransferase
MDQACSVRLAGPGDADAIGTIGPAIYAESYGHMWDDAVPYARHLASFAVDAMLTFMQRDDARVIVAEYEGHIVGFLSLISFSEDPVDRLATGAEIPRLYLLRPARGRGIGAQLVEKAERLAELEGADHLWLDVMQSAPWAWRTYLEWGFQMIGMTQFNGGIAPAYRQLIVMRRAIQSHFGG